MTADELIALAKKSALKYGLDGNLVCAVVEQESGWNPWAIRYEPGFYDRYVRPRVERGILRDLTEARARAFSWGLMQVMGETAREAGLSGHIASLCDPEIGIEIGCHVLSEKFADAQGNVKDALLAWNGGGNPMYPDEVLNRMSKYGK